MFMMPSEYGPFNRKSSHIYQITPVTLKWMAMGEIKQSAEQNNAVWAKALMFCITIQYLSFFVGIFDAVSFTYRHLFSFTYSVWLNVFVAIQKKRMSNARARKKKYSPKKKWQKKLLIQPNGGYNTAKAKNASSQFNTNGFMRSQTEYTKSIFTAF